MKIEPNFLSELMQLVNGQIITLADAALQAEQMGSIEELFASMILHEGVDQVKQEITHRIVILAHEKIVKAESQRQESGFPIEEQQAQQELDAALYGLIKADSSMHVEQAKVHDALIKTFLYRKTPVELIRYGLNIKY